MRYVVLMLSMLALAGCAGTQYDSPKHEIARELDRAAKQQPPVPANIENALLPPLKMDIPGGNKPSEPRFDLSVNDASAREVFMSIVSGTHYNMLVSPDVNGTISVNLKDVTVFEALDAIRELYGYDYSLDGNNIYIQPISLQTRVFKVNYLAGSRKGNSDMRVISGSVSDASTSPSTVGGQTTFPGTTSHSLESSRVSTTSLSDYLTEITAALKAIVGSEGGRKVVVSPQSGIIVVRAMPNELRSVEQFLKASQLSVDRQVMLEAKIISVELNDSYQAGINWSAFRISPNSRVSLGVIGPGAVLSPGGILSATGSPISGTPGSNISSNAATGTMFGMTFQTGNFAALLSFLETQGTVHVLSSPRIATLNNQQAILKVGTDDFFVTNVSYTTTTGTATTTTPSVTLQPFFSGIMLDVTPQIDSRNNIILHIHPSVSQVTQKTQKIDLGV
ncbi:MAG TPA: secretin N-terminal domain-containing protein, partial [Burkholderiales bacterium]|nr:secretin N-terminal domain-containing protein [Burkholderiales bacterium]